MENIVIERKQKTHQKPRPRSPVKEKPLPMPRPDKPPLLEIVQAMPRSIQATEIAAFVNAQCGILGREVPTPMNSYSISEIYETMVAEGYRQKPIAPPNIKSPVLYERE